MPELLPTTFDALILAAMTSIVLYELIDVSAPRLMARIRAR